MRARPLTALLALAALAMLCAAPASAEARAYRAFVGCGAAFPEPDHACSIGAAPAAYFKSFRRTVRYTVCIRNPEPRTRCRRSRATRGRYDWLYVGRATVGSYQVTWFVRGKRVARWHYWMYPEIGA
jgi:hypothetical protein